jgi:hypothetical protein
VTGILSSDSDPGIPAQAISNQLNTLYETTLSFPTGTPSPGQLQVSGSTTKGLMAQVALVESGKYQQFRNPPGLYKNPTYPYSVVDSWPLESGPGKNARTGGHIGLMQLPINGTIENGGTSGQADAWDWTKNTSDGVALFQTGFPKNTAKLQLAYNNANTMYENHPGIPALTSCQLEEMALELYGPGAAGTNLNVQYYVPKCVNGKGSNCAGGQWQWEINLANLCGVCYVAAVRATVPLAAPPSMATSCSASDPPFPDTAYNKTTTFEDACSDSDINKKCPIAIP